MTSSGPGSTYHLSSLRYAQGSREIRASNPRFQASTPAHSSASRQSSRLFEDAEDGYRPGQSSSSSLLIRSNVLPLDVDSSEVREGFQRTKVRSMLAQSMPMEYNQGADPFLGVQISDIGSSIYLHNRRAKNPMTRADYSRERKRRRLARQKARVKEKASPTLEEEEGEEGEGEEGEEEEEEEVMDEDQAMQRENEKEAVASAEKISGEMQADAELLASELPSGSLMETIHYLAAHYYGARGLLRQRDTFDNKGVEGQRLNMWRVCEGSALVGLAIYLEEMIKYQSTAEPDEELHRISSKENAQVADQLAALQKDIKNKKRRKVDRKVRGMKLLDNNWAKVRRRKKPKRSSTIGISSSSDSSEDEEQDDGEGRVETEEENEEDANVANNNVE